MPLKPLHPCPGRGPRYRRCPNLVRSGVCAECQPYENAIQKENDKQRGTATERGYDGKWAKIREIKLSKDPLCERCLLKGRIIEAVIVHHKDRNPKNNQLDNLESICLHHHEKEHKEDRWKR